MDLKKGKPPRCDLHNKSLKSICLAKLCSQNRLLCQSCIKVEEDHKTHDKHILDFESFLANPDLLVEKAELWTQLNIRKPVDEVLKETDAFYSNLEEKVDSLYDRLLGSLQKQVNNCREQFKAQIQKNKQRREKLMRILELAAPRRLKTVFKMDMDNGLKNFVAAVNQGLSYQTHVIRSLKEVDNNEAVSKLEEDFRQLASLSGEDLQQSLSNLFQMIFDIKICWYTGGSIAKFDEPIDDKSLVVSTQELKPPFRVELKVFGDPLEESIAVGIADKPFKTPTRWIRSEYFEINKGNKGIWRAEGAPSYDEEKLGTFTGMDSGSIVAFEVDKNKRVRVLLNGTQLADWHEFSHNMKCYVYFQAKDATSKCEIVKVTNLLTSGSAASLA
eukprot:TRINITY_DN1746_c0_g1_i1.p1 TRINITY_DN1746_c0_g1~~TRINITY_DN1746_c0_g1_i1.p1  ORF type:complete len:387 (-),score=54.30 TRINITY_DN1746_c0_g1_i1:171-1331(-)